MAVNTPNMSYTAMSSKWRRCRDAIAGQDTVHAAGEVYLPKLGGQTKEDYDAYVKRASYYNASGRTVDALVGLVFRRDPVIEAPESLSDIIDDVTGSGVSVVDFSKSEMTQVLSVARGGILVDHPVSDGSVVTVAQARSLGLRPRWQHYSAEDIIDWKTASIGGRTVLSQVRLREIGEEPDGEWDVGFYERVRVLELDEHGLYRQRVFREVGGLWQVVEIVEPLIGGRRMGWIPFHIASADIAAGFDPAMPPLLDLVDTNLSHYRTSADLEYGAHYTALPTPVLSGYRPEPGNENKPINIGPSSAIIFSDPQGKASFLEYAGQGLSTLERLLAAKEARMAALGARMLAPEKKAAEAAETEAIRRAGENSALSSIAGSVSATLTNALKDLVRWASGNASMDVSNVWVDLNRDYLPMTLTAPEIDALVRTWQAGGISAEDMHSAFVRGEVVEAWRKREDVEADLKDEAKRNPQPAPEPEPVA